MVVILVFLARVVPTVRILPLRLIQMTLAHLCGQSREYISASWDNMCFHSLSDQHDLVTIPSSLNWRARGDVRDQHRHIPLEFDFGTSGSVWRMSAMDSTLLSQRKHRDMDSRGNWSTDWLLLSPESFLWGEHDRRNQYAITDMYIMLVDGNVSLWMLLALLNLSRHT